MTETSDPEVEAVYLYGTKVVLTKSAGLDGAVVVFIDTEFEPDGSDGGPGLRVRINDDLTYDGVAYAPREGGRDPE